LRKLPAKPSMFTCMQNLREKHLYYNTAGTY
jgi:hypothetical protein